MLNKKRCFGFVCLVIVVSLVVPSAFAGVGIFYEQQNVRTAEGGQTCLTYKLYNPFNEESVVSASVSGELQEILVSVSEEKTVPANTPASSAVPIELCFEVPEVYKGDSDCSGAEKKYTGYVLVTENPKSAGVASGSSTAAAISAPLTLIVECVPDEGGAGLLYPVLAIIIGIVIVSLLFVRYRSRSEGVASPVIKGDVKNTKGNK